MSESIGIETFKSQWYDMVWYGIDDVIVEMDQNISRPLVIELNCLGAR